MMNTQRLSGAAEPVPVESRQVVKTVLAAVNDSVPARRALATAVGLAWQLGAKLVVLHVVDISKGFSPELALLREAALEELRQRGHNFLLQLREALPPELSFETRLRHGEPPAEILQTADDCGADLIVLGTYGHNRLSRMLLGTTAEAVVRGARVPVVTAGAAPTAAERPVAQAPQRADETRCEPAMAELFGTSASGSAIIVGA